MLAGVLAGGGLGMVAWGWWRAVAEVQVHMLHMLHMLHVEVVEGGGYIKVQE